MKTTLSEKYMERSRALFPGGVNSPVRSFASVGGTPIVFDSGKGKHLFDVDGNCYVDFCSSWGPLILGYSYPRVVDAIVAQAQKAVTFGAPSTCEVTLGEYVKSLVPGLDMMRFVSSGTEATMSALRAARAATGRNKIIKFEGCYHGHADMLLVKAGSGLATHFVGEPTSQGVPPSMTQDTIVLPYNDIEAIINCFNEFGPEIAAVIVEPMAANMGLIKPIKGFLEQLRLSTSAHKSILIYDEVMTGFRLCAAGAQEIFQVKPDMWTFGKIIGGGLPAAAYGGRDDIMRCVAPLGRAYQAGTLSGNPLAMAAGFATLQEVVEQNGYEKLEQLGKKLDVFVDKNLSDLPVCYVRQGSFFCFFFGTNTPPENFYQASITNMAVFAKVYHACLENGLYLGPSGYEVGFLSLAHDESDLEKLCFVIAKTLKNL